MNLKETIEEARSLGVTEVTVNGITYKLGSAPTSHEPVPDQEAKDIVQPMSVLDQYSDEEILFYSTNYFDELQAKKKQHEEHLKERE